MSDPPSSSLSPAPPAGYEGANCETKTPCACSNGGAATGTIVDGDCACDCTGTDYSGDTCTLCTTTNDANTNCEALTDTTIGNAYDGAADTAINEWLADADAATAKWGHISEW